VTNVDFQFNPMASNNVTWLSYNTILLPDSRKIDLWNLSLLILSVLVDLGPGSAGGLFHCVTISSIHSLGSFGPVSMEWIKILAPFTISVALSSFTSFAVTTVVMATLVAKAFPCTRSNCGFPNPSFPPDTWRGRVVNFIFLDVTCCLE
jgi:hypothetical protein